MTLISRFMLPPVLAAMLAPTAFGQPAAPWSDCENGRCPIIATPPVSPAQPASPQIDARAIVRVTNAVGTRRALGTGTLVDADSQSGLVLTCAHLFRDGTGTVDVAFHNGDVFEARLMRIDTASDLAALSIGAPGVEPVDVAQSIPERGDPLASCGYGSDGRLWCNRGQALGYVSTHGAGRFETLELSGSARFGDSGGPVLNDRHELVAVLFGSNGRVVDGTFCGRIRRFLQGLSPRFRQQRPDDGLAKPSPVAPPTNVTPAAPAIEPDRLARLEQVVEQLRASWQSLNTKVEGLVSLVQSIRAAPPAPGDSGLSPPKHELPPGMDPIGPIEDAARPWLSGKVAALLISLGLPAGIAGVAGGAIVYLAMRRGRRRLQAQVARLRTRLGTAVAAGNPADLSISAEPFGDPAVIERHHNRYVPYEVSTLDRAWAAAHARIGEKYPGAVPYLKMAEGVKDQLLSGKAEAVHSEGSDS
jgi:hypothetical protein